MAKKIVMTFKVSPSQKGFINALAKHRGCYSSEIIIKALREHFEKSEDVGVCDTCGKIFPTSGNTICDKCSDFNF